MTKKPVKTGKELEQRIAQAYRDMGAWKVEHNVELSGHQIDVYVELMTAGHSLHRIAIEAKDYTSPVGIRIVEDFSEIVARLRRQGLIDEGIISAASFSRQARNAAQDEHIRLLTPDDLDAMVAKAKAAPRPAPTSLHQLQPPPADFTGREYELATLTAAVETGGAVICGLRGMGGVGKTVLALRLAQQLTPRYPDAQFYLNLQGTSSKPLTPAEAMAHVIRAYHPTAQLPESEAELSALYRSALYEQHAILLMDNAASRAQVKPLLPPSSCLFLVTSRRHFTLPDLRSLNLDKLPAPDARDLLLKIAPHLQSGSADKIAELCGYLPLALRLAGSALGERIDIDPADYLEQLTDAQTRLSLVDASLSLSYNLLDTELQRLWCLLSVFPATFDRAAVSSVWEMNDAPTQDALSSLVSYSLIEWNSAASRYSLHDLTRLFVKARSEKDDNDAARRRHAAHYGAVLRAADELYLQGDESIERGLALFDVEWPNIQAGQAWATEHLQKNIAAAHLCNDYPEASAYCLNLRLHSREWIRWMETAVDAARKLEDREAEGNHLGNLGLAYSDLGQVEKAIEHYEQALAIFREIGDRRGEGAELGNLGNVYSALGQVEKAREMWKQALHIFEAIKSPNAERVQSLLDGLDK